MASDMTQGEAVGQIAHHAGVQEQMLNQRFSQFLATGDITVTSTAGRARMGDANGRCVIKRWMRRQLPRLIKEELVKNDYPITTYSVAQLISDQFFDGEEDVISDGQVGRIMYQLGYSRGRLRQKYVETPERKERVDRFIVEYTAARKKDAEDNTHILAWTDESYIHQNHARGVGQFYVLCFFDCIMLYTASTILTHRFVCICRLVPQREATTRSNKAQK